MTSTGMAGDIRYLLAETATDSSSNLSLHHAPEIPWEDRYHICSRLASISVIQANMARSFWG
jgi:hypothetical protein